MKKKRLGFLIASILAVFSSVLVSIGFGSWFVENDTTKQYTKTPDTTARKVAYTRNGSTNTYYTSIESALDKTSSGTIYVIPGSNPTITRNCEIRSGVTLSIPYEDDLQNTHNTLLEKGNNGSSFGDNVAANLVTRVTIQNSTLTINGTLIMGGVTGSDSGVQSAVSGKYTEILLNSSSITVNGELDCYGFIKNNDSSSKESTISVYGTLKTPIAVYDYSSASTLLDIYSNGVFPFKQFDVSQIRPEITFYYNSSFIGRIHTYGKTAGDLNMDATLIANDSAFICLNNEQSVVKWKFDNLSGTITDNEIKQHKTTISIFGDCSAGSLVIKIKYIIRTYTIDSKDFYLPIPCSYNVILKEGGTFKVPNTIHGLKFMPGSSLTGEQNSTITFEANTIFYQGLKALDGSSFGYPVSTPAKYTSLGKTIIKAGFDGEVLIGSITRNDEASIITEDAYTPAISDSKEGTTKSVYSWGGGRGILLVKSFDVAATNGYFYENDGVKNLIKNKSYSSKFYTADKTGIGWYDDSNSNVNYHISFVSNLDSSTNPNEGKIEHFRKNGDALKLNSLVPDDPSLYLFEGFFYDVGCSTNPLPYESSSNQYLLDPVIAEAFAQSDGYVTIYGKWKNIESGLFEFTTITNQQNNEKTGVSNLTSTTNKEVGSSITLEDKSGDKLYYYQNINPSNKTGTLEIGNFNGYAIEIKDPEGNLVENINVDKNGNSIGSDVVNNFVFNSSNIVAKDYNVTIKEVLETNEYNYTFGITGGSSTINQGKNSTVSATYDSSFDANSINLTFAWTKSDAKIGMVANGNSCTLTNNYTETTRLAWKTEETTFSVSYSVSDGSLVLAKGVSKDVKAEKISLKLL